jgi:hypothetical protein
MNMYSFFGWAAPVEDLPIRNAEGPTLQSLDSVELSAVGRAIVTVLSQTYRSSEKCPQGLIDLPVTGVSQLMSTIPGLRTLDADAMHVGDVSRLAEYMLTKRPDLFDEAIAVLSEEYPAGANALETIRKEARGGL